MERSFLLIFSRSISIKLVLGRRKEGFPVNSELYEGCKMIEESFSRADIMDDETLCDDSETHDAESSELSYAQPVPLPPVITEVVVEEPYPEVKLSAKRKRGRPKGSKNKKKPDKIEPIVIYEEGKQSPPETLQLSSLSAVSTAVVEEVIQIDLPALPRGRGRPKSNGTKKGKLLDQGTVSYDSDVASEASDLTTESMESARKRIRDTAAAARTVPGYLSSGTEGDE